MAALVVTGVYFWLCRLAGEHAAEIFNAEMARQKTLEGSVAVESITADMWGNVGFRGLKWLDAEGEPVVFVPDGRFKVKPWDVVTGSINLNSLEEAELNHPVIAIRFNKDMRPAFLPEKKKDAGQETERRHKGLHINLPENLPQSSIKINDCTITASYRHRYFVLSGVNAAVHTVNPQEAALKITAAGFGGMMIGDELGISGKLLLNGGQPQCDLYISMKMLCRNRWGLARLKIPPVFTGMQRGRFPGFLSTAELNFCSLIYRHCVFTKLTAISFIKTAKLISAM